MISSKDSAFVAGYLNSLDFAILWVDKSNFVLHYIERLFLEINPTKPEGIFWNVVPYDSQNPLPPP